MSRVHALLDAVVRLKRTSQSELAERSGIHPSNLSKFFSGETDIRTSSLEKILQTVDISLEHILENEIEKLIGKSKHIHSVGAAIETLLKDADPISAKTFIDSLSSRVKPKASRNVTAALQIVNDYKIKIKTTRRS